MDYFEWENSMFKRGMFLLIESLRTRRCFHRTTRPEGMKWSWFWYNRGIPSMEMIQGIIPYLVSLPSGYQTQGIWRNGFIPRFRNSRIELLSGTSEYDLSFLWTSTSQWSSDKEDWRLWFGQTWNGYFTALDRKQGIGFRIEFCLEIGLDWSSGD